MVIFAGLARARGGQALPPVVADLDVTWRK
jgi:hypothetical protein